jgi:hypothetical protein
MNKQQLVAFWSGTIGRMAINEMVQMQIDAYLEQVPKAINRCSAFEAIRQHTNQRYTTFQFILSQICKIIDFADFACLNAVSRSWNRITNSAPLNPQYNLSWTVTEKQALYFGKHRNSSISKNLERISALIDHSGSDYENRASECTDLQSNLNDVINYTLPNCRYLCLFQEPSDPNGSYHINSPKKIIKQCPKLESLLYYETRCDPTIELLKDSVCLKKVEFDFNSLIDLSSKVVEFIKSHTKLEEIILREHISDDKFLQIANDCPKLQSLHIHADKLTIGKGFITFLEKHKALTYLILRIDEKSAEILNQIFGKNFLTKDICQVHDTDLKPHFRSDCKECDMEEKWYDRHHNLGLYNPYNHIHDDEPNEHASCNCVFISQLEKQKKKKIRE